MLDFSSLKNAVESLNKAITRASRDKHDDEVRDAVIQRFEYTFELSWKLMRRWLTENLGSEYIDGIPREELFRIAAENRLIVHVENWFKYQKARNQTVHVYDQEIAREVFEIAKKFSKDVQILLNNLESKNV